MMITHHRYLEIPFYLPKLLSVTLNIILSVNISKSSWVPFQVGLNRHTLR